MTHDDKTTFLKTRRNKLSNKPLMTAEAEPVFAHATIVTDRRLCHCNGREFLRNFFKNWRALSFSMQFFTGWTTLNWIVHLPSEKVVAKSFP
jgi:hypothetical protein